MKALIDHPEQNQVITELSPLRIQKHPSTTPTCQFILWHTGSYNHLGENKRGLCNELPECGRSKHWVFLDRKSSSPSLYAFSQRHGAIRNLLSSLLHHPHVRLHICKLNGSHQHLIYRSDTQNQTMRCTGQLLLRDIDDGLQNIIVC